MKSDFQKLDIQKLDTQKFFYLFSIYAQFLTNVCSII